MQRRIQRFIDERLVQADDPRKLDLALQVGETLDAAHFPVRDFDAELVLYLEYEFDESERIYALIRQRRIGVNLGQVEGELLDGEVFDAVRGLHARFQAKFP